MSILFCSPMFGNACTRGYFMSCLALQEELLSQGIDHSWLTTGNESLIQRARNTSVATFLKTDFEYLFFIDADIEFLPGDVAKLWNLEVPVSAGSYPMKKEGVKTTVWKDGKLIDLDVLEGPTEVDFVGTGFLLIHRDVFVQMKRHFPERSHMEGRQDSIPATVDKATEDNMVESFSWFDPRVSKGDSAKERCYLSEDYAWSEDYRMMGGKIIIDPSIRLIHHGVYAYGDKESEV